MKPLAISLLGTVVLAALSVTGAVASPPNLTGTWNVEQTTPTGTTTATLTVTQSGNSFVGKSSKGATFNGTFVDDSKINGKWRDATGGVGWLTVYVSPNGHSFNGTAGPNGKPAGNTFVGNKVLPPSPITAAGKWVLKGAGNAGGFIGPMTCTQSGPTVVCHVGGAIVMNGKFRTTDKVRATWTSSAGTGWFSFWFNDDNNSFNGVWGNGADTTPAVGRVVGQRVLQ